MNNSVNERRNLAEPFFSASDQSAQALRALERMRERPIQRFSYQDLEAGIWSRWQVRPRDITINHISDALYLLMSVTDGGVWFDQTSFEQAGIDFDRLMPQIRSSASTRDIQLVGPKVPRLSHLSRETKSISESSSAHAEIESIAPAGETEIRSGSVDSSSVDFGSEPGRSRALTTYANKYACSHASLARTAKVNPSDVCHWRKGQLPARSDKSARIERVLRNSELPTLPSKRRTHR